MSNVAQLREELVAVRKQATEILEAGGAERKLSIQQVEELRGKNARMADLRGQIDQAAEIATIEANVKATEDAAERGGRTPLPGTRDGGNGNGRFVAKSLGQLFAESAALKDFDPRNRRETYASVDAPWLAAKGVLHSDWAAGVTENVTYAAGTASGQTGNVNTFGANNDTTQASTYWPSQPMYVGMNGLSTNLRQPMLADLIPSALTTSSQIKYMEEVTTSAVGTNAVTGRPDGNNADSVLEGRLKPESYLSFIEKTAEVKKLATVLPVTEELLADVPAAQGFIDQRLRLFLEQEEEDQILNGNPSVVPSDLPGLLNQAGRTQINAASFTTIPLADLIYTQMTRIRVDTGLDPSAIVMHPNVWRDIRLTRTPDGVYIWGNPSEVGVDTLWGMNVVQSKMAYGGTNNFKVLIGAFSQAMQIYRRADVSFGIADQHEDYFRRNMLLLRVEKRLALVHYRPQAFSEIFNISAA